MAHRLIRFTLLVPWMLTGSVGALEPARAQRMHLQPGARARLMDTIKRALTRGRLGDEKSVAALSALFALAPCLDGAPAEEAAVWYARSFVTDPFVFLATLRQVERQLADGKSSLARCQDTLPVARGTFLVVDRVFDLLAVELIGRRPPADFPAKLLAAQKNLRGAEAARFFDRLEGRK